MELSMSRFLAFPCALLLGLSVVSAAAPGNVLVVANRTEPSVAINPASPSTVVIGTNTDYSSPIGGTYPVGYFTSHDGGRFFSGGSVPVLPPFTTGADPTVRIAASGTVFYSYLGETPSYCSGGRSAVLLSTSSDGGDSFRVPTEVDQNNADDKPNMAVQSIRGGRARVFLTWTRWYNSGSEIWFARSLTGGDSFSRAALLYGSRLDNFGSTPVFDRRGRMYVFWSQFAEEPLTATTKTSIYMAVSFDHGAHFRPAHRISGYFRAIPHMTQPASLRNLPQPVAVAAPDGTVYVTWAQVSRSFGHGRVDADIVVIRSADGGQTWTRPYRVNDVRRGDRFMPALDILGDGTLGIAFYDRRDSLYQLSVYAVRVSLASGLHRSANMRVNQQAAPVGDVFYIKPGSTCFSPGRFFGDYIGVSAAPGNAFCVTWADTQRHTYNETDIWFQRINLPSVTH
jgi:hypothetical protein